ncbi:MAG: MATE family efflux transporter [Acidimicrobiales bacterium]|nr:MATE family efflux transporter [Acidimicrobiales bacterium]
MRPDDRELLRLAVPALGALLAEPLYVLADTAVVGHLGTAELGGLAVASAALLFGYGMCIFLAYGTTAAVARLTGAGEDHRAAHQAVQGLWLALVLGVVLALLGGLFAGPMLRLLGADGEVLAQAGTYFRISLLGTPAMLMMLAGVGYLRGVKDTVRPLWVAAGTALLNLVLEVVLIYGFDRAIGASAAATVVAQWLGAGCYLAWIGRGVRRLDVSLAPDLRVIGRLLGVSAELMVRNLSLTGTFLIATAAATRIGDVEVAAHQVAFQVWMVLALSMDAVAIAAQAMVGNLLGAHDPDGARAVGRRVIGWSIAIGAVLGAAIVAAHGVLGQVFSADDAVVALAGFLLLHVGLMAPLSGVAFAFDGILIGAGDQRFLARAMVGAAAVAVPVMVATRLADLGIGPLWAGIWAFMVVRGLSLGVRFRNDRWQVLGAGS